MGQEAIAEKTSRVSGHDDEQTRRIATLYRLTGIERRHLVVIEHESTFIASLESGGPGTRWRMRRYDEQVRPLARKAASRALSAAGVLPGEVSHLVTVSCTGFAAPGFDIGLIHDLKLEPTVERTHVGFMGCHGALNGLRVAAALAGSDPNAVVLLCAAELCSLHFQYGVRNGSDVANALFADGAAALVGRAASDAKRPPRNGFSASGEAAAQIGSSVVQEGAPGWAVRATGSCIAPDTSDVMSWQVGDHGFEMALGTTVCAAISRHVRPWLTSWLAKQGLAIGDVGSWAIHPGGPRILDVACDALGLPYEATADSRAVLCECGNMSSPTVLFIIDRLRARGASLPCVALAFGPGLTIEATLID